MSQNTIDVDALRTMLALRRPVTILDIRPAAERAEWVIPGSLHVDVYDDVKAGRPNALATLELPHDRPVVTVCGAGKTSLLAAEQLQARGWEAMSLQGGMQAWSLAWNHVAFALPDGQAQIVQVRRTGKGCLSYLIGSAGPKAIGSAGAAAVVDAALPPAVYLDLAREHGWSITHVLETHIHADHLSRGRLLAEQCGAILCLPAQKRVTYPFRPLADGDALTVGAARIAALRTPGHTPESTCYLLDDQALFTGDTLFLAGVGRPDLEATPAEARQRAHQLYASLQRLLALPAQTLVLPGHTSDSVAFDQAPLAATLGEVRARVELLQMAEEAFVERLLARIPPTPPNHHRIVELNEAGRLPDGDPTDLEAGANRCAVN